MGEAQISTEPLAFVLAHPGKPISRETDLGGAGYRISTISPEPDLRSLNTPAHATLTAARAHGLIAILDAKLPHPAAHRDAIQCLFFLLNPDLLTPTRVRLISLLEWTRPAINDLQDIHLTAQYLKDVIQLIEAGVVDGQLAPTTPYRLQGNPRSKNFR